MKLRKQLKKTVEVDGHKATFVFTERDRPYWVPPRSPYQRGYMSESTREYNKKPRLYVDTSGETLLDNLANRTTRPVNVWGKAVRRALADLELPGRIGWSQRAGCSCPCSPGFIWTDAPALVFENGYAHRRYDVWVTLEDAPLAREDAEAQATQLARAGAVANDPTLPVELLASTTL